ncbi:MAG TPA: ATPase, T2SS/T4P/T4SS family [Planctomycetota bacterium]|nr:ATPase, T2SS/T4P/T4SS family [Planctomycetota bacterium]
MNLAQIIATAARRGASDVHVAAGQPIVLRVRGELVLLDGEPSPTPAATEAMARALLREDEWESCVTRGSADKALTLEGARCRINVLHSGGHVGLAVRLLPGDEVSVRSLNLHPDLRKLVEPTHGLVIVSGPTGCGKSSTLAALVQEINRTRARHIVTIEQPVEFDLVPAHAFIRQREVGRDTPSFAQGVVDAMREDIDVLAVGEMRERETMRLTLDACETGHLVLATMHSGTAVEALQRVVSAFPAEEQPSVCAQLADVLLAVVTQHLVWRDDPGLRVPECEVLLATTPVKAVLRQGQMFKLGQILETGSRQGMWTLPRYREWLDSRTEWVMPAPVHAQPEPRRDAGPPRAPAAAPQRASPPGEDVIVIRPEKGTVADILSELDKDPP